MDSLVESLSEFSSTESITTEITESSSSVANPVEAQTPRLKPVWQSPVWKFFVIAEDIKYAKCNTCNELVPRGGGSMKSFNTTNLVNHLKSKHHEEFDKFQDIRKNKEAQRQAAKSERIQERSNQLGGMRQLTLQATKQRTSFWGLNDPRALCIHRKIGEMIAVDNQPFSLVEDIGFIRLLHTLEPRYNLPSRKYFSETIVPSMVASVHDGINIKLRNAKHFSFTTDIWSTNVSSDSLLSFTAHWITNDFQRLSAVLNVKLLEGSHTGAHLCEQYSEILKNWNIGKSQVHLVLRDNAKNMEKGLRDADLPNYGCFAHSLQLVVHDGVLKQRSVVDLLSLCRGIVGHFKRSSLAYGKLHQIQESLSLPQHRLKQDEPTRWNSSLYMLQSIVEQKMAIAAYGSENDISVLNQTQLDLANKVIKVLEPIEEITKVSFRRFGMHLSYYTSSQSINQDP